jgi:hypothetical protein
MSTRPHSCCRGDHSVGSAEAGCSANEIMAISGHATMKEIVRYTAAADQARK